MGPLWNFVSRSLEFQVPKRNLLERCATLQMSTWDEIVGEDSDDNDMTGSLEKSCKNIARSVLRQAFRQCEFSSIRWLFLNKTFKM